MGNGCSVRSELCFPDATFCRTLHWKCSWRTEVSHQRSLKKDVLTFDSIYLHVKYCLVVVGIPVCVLSPKPSVFEEVGFGFIWTKL